MPIHDDLLNPRRRNPLLLPLAAIVLLGLVGGAFALGRNSGSGGEAAKAPAQPAVVAEAPVAEAPPAPPPPPAAPAMGDVLPGTDGLRRVKLEIQGSLAASINGVVGSEVGDPLGLVASRLLVWWLDPARDLRPGDDLELLYSLPAGEEPMVHALRVRSGKLGKELRAYRWQAPGAPFARYYDGEGAEVELRLKDGPIDGYEQVTSLLKDGRKHKGVDFKAPVGSPVTMPWDGTVKRKNWNFRFNGGSVELVDGKGRSVIFLHLESVDKSLAVGSRVRKGQVVAHSGNTGRSTAPHLHYQVMSANGKVLDPFDLHDTYRVALPAGQKADFAARAAELGALLEGKQPVAAPAPAAAPAGAAPEQADAAG